MDDASRDGLDDVPGGGNDADAGGDVVSIEHHDSLAETPTRSVALACLRAAISAARPEQVIARSVHLDGDLLTIDSTTYDLGAFDRIVVVGGGKAATGVANALESLLGERIDAGAVVTTDPGVGDRIEHLQGSHPIPSEAGVEATERVTDLVRTADERTLVLAAITGGASALLPAPAEGISLLDLQTTTDALLESGAAISEINAVRKHLSSLKGGGLARLAAPATIVGLVFSDVVGNELSVIASGPTAPDESTFEDALDALDRYGIDAPTPVRERLERGAAGDLPETPRPDDPVFERVHNHVLVDGFVALDAAGEVAREQGYTTCLLSSRVRGESREAAKTHVAIAEEIAATGHPVAPPAVVLSGGETTVTVRGAGEGGPNLEFALSAAIELRTFAREVALVSVDSDGRDGGTAAAGALVDDGTVEDLGAAREALADNDTLGYLRGRNAVVRTGPTGTNVNDLRIVVIE